MKRGLQLFCVALIALSAGKANAQQFFTTVSAVSSNTIPLNFSTNKVQELYYPLEMNTAPYAGFITKIYFKNFAAVTNPTFTNLTVKLGTTNIAGFVTGPWYSTTTVFNAATYTFSGTQPAQTMIGLTLQTPFFYDGSSNIIFEMSQDGYSPGMSMSTASLTPNRRMYGSTASPTATADGIQIGFGFDMIPAAGNNASANAITEPANFCAGTYPVKLRIKNNGNNTINNVLINWTLDGVAQPQIAYTNPPLPSALNPPTNQAIVTLGSVTFPASGSRTIKAWTSQPNGVADTYNGDDTVTAVLGSALNGIYTVGGTTPDFPTIAAAANALNNFGVCGPVTMNVRSGTYTNDQASLNSISGASAINRVTFKSEANSAAAVIFNTANATAAANYIFSLNGSSYITIRDLTLNPTNATYGKAINIATGCSYDSVVNCSMTLTSGSTSTSADRAAVYMSGPSGPGYIVLQGNTITNATYGIYFFGSSTIALSTNNVIDNNTLINPYYMGIYCYYQSSTRITNNTITSTATPYSTLYCIYSPYNDDASEVSGNKITVTGAASVYGLYRYYCDGVTNARGRVFNNVINITGTGSIYGLDLYYSSNQDVCNNTVQVSATSTTAYAGYLYCTSTTTAGNNVNNNIFNLTGTTGSAVYNYNPQYALSDYNNVFGGANLFQSVTPALSTNSLSTWRITGQSDRNSICYRPGFINATNLQPNPADTAVWSIHGRGIQIVGNGVDINGAPRPTTLAAGVPDLGAYEFVPTALPPVAIAVPAVSAPGTSQAFTFGQDTVAVLNWGATSAVPLSLAVRQYSGIVPTGLPAGSFMYFYTDVALTGTGLNYTSNIYYKDPWKGTSPISEGAIRMASKNGAAAWVSYPGAASSIEVNRNILTVANMTTTNWFTGRVDNCTGTPVAATITNPPILSAFCAGQSAFLTASDNVNTVAGITYRWQSAPSATGPWTNINGATTLSLNTPPLTATTWFRIVDTCVPSNQGAASAAYQVPVANPQIVSTAPATRCGPGTVTLSATGGPTTSLRWYAAATGGTALSTGASFTTPSLVATTTYYVEAYEGLCTASPRQAVTATVTPGPAFNVTDSIVVCNNAPATLTVNTPTANYTSYTWSPNTNLFTDAAGTIPYTGTSSSTVYLKTSTSGAYTVYVNALETTSQCAGLDTVKVYVLPDSSNVAIDADPDTICISGTTILKLNPLATYGSGLIRWYKSQNGVSYTLINGPTSPTYNTGIINSDTFFRVRALNTAGDVCISKDQFIYRDNPLVTGTTPATRCGPGTVNLAATGTVGTTLNWYATPTGGNSLFSGPTFTTPILPATTTYYVGATSGSSATHYNAGIVNSNLGNPFVTSTAGWGLIFTVNIPCTIDSVGVYPNANGTIAVNIQNATTNAPILTSAVFPVTGTGSNKVMLPVNFTLPPGTYKMGVSSYTGFTNLGNEAFSSTAFPYTSVPVNITSSSQGAGAVTSTYYFFYDWKITAGSTCESPRVAVTGTVTPSNLFTVTDTQSVCNNAPATLTVTSPTNGYDQVTWTPIANLYTDPAATTFPYVFNTNASTVYSRTATAGYYAYRATGLNTTNNCQGMDTAVVFTQSVVTAINASPDTLCFSGSSTLTIAPTAPYFANSLSWFNSIDNGATYNPIAGATATSYTTPVINDTVWYRIRTKNSAGATCQDFNKAMIVKIPTIIDTNNRTRCGVGTVTLDAYALPGYGVNWYTTASSATSPNPFFTGNNYTTPTLFNSTTYYVSAGSGSSGGLGLPDRVGATSNTGVGVIGLIFDVFSPMTLQSVAMYPTHSSAPGAGTVTISVYNSANVIVPGLTTTVNVTGALAPGVKTVIPLNFAIPPGTGYRLGLTAVSGGVNGAVREVTTGYTFPYTLPGVASITTAVTGGTATGTYYYYFYDWKVSSGCSSDRIPVTATVTPAPQVNVTPKIDSICYGQSAMFTASSANPGYRYTWNPVQVPGPVLSIQPGATTTYYLYAFDTTNNPVTKTCAFYDTVKAVVLPNPIADVIPLSTTTFCAGDSVRLKSPFASDYTYQWKRNGVNMPGALDSTILVTAAGSYTVQVKKAGFCTTLSDPELVTVNPLPNPTIGISNGILNTGAFNSYQWLRNGLTILGATGQQYVPTQNGDYTVAVTDANGCSNTSSIWRVSNTGVAIVNGIGGAVVISPNPTTGVMTIKAPVKVNAVVTTLDGRVVLRQDGATRVDLTGIADGVYFLRVLDAADGALLKSEKILKAE